MKNEKVKLNQLRADYAELYRELPGWGFECGDGWHDLLRRLTEKINAEMKTLPVDEREACCVVQVKEKFGTLRYYMHGSTRNMEAMIRVAEGESARTCEDCGAEGTLRSGSWIRVLCDACEAAIMAKLKSRTSP